MKAKREVRAKDVLEDLQKGLQNSELQEKYRLSGKGLVKVLRTLVSAKLLNIKDIEDRLAILPKPESSPETRQERRCYPGFGILIHELDDLAEDYYIQDISLSGFKITGMPTKVGESRTFLIEADEFVDVFPFSLKAECRWVKADSNMNEYVAGFEITKITEQSLNELKQIIKHMTAQIENAVEELSEGRQS